MRCSKCGAENPENKKFCGKCGARLSGRCVNCGAENPPDNTFCGDCGASLSDRMSAGSAKVAAAAMESATVRISPETTETLDGERKTVTALFADIKGSMELMENLDPEEARAIVDPALKLMMDAVHRYEGYVAQSTGDGIFALFGAPVAHEDHPQRALHAARRMQEDLKRYANVLRQRGQPPLLVRVGVNSGEVVVRSIQTGDAHTEYTPIGHSVSLASRLQTLAAPGSVVIGENVRKFVDGYFRLNALGASRIKGVSEPVEVFEVVGLGPLRTRLQRSAGRGLTKFVGREREMEALRHAADQAKAARGQIVAAMAEPGVGKSRLFHEFKAKHQTGWMVLDAVSVSYGKASAYLPVIDVLHGYFRIAADDDARTRREKIIGKVLGLDRALEDTLPYLFGLLGIVEGNDPLAQMDAQIRRQRTLDTIKRILLRESLNQPLMIIFEDLHCVDEETQAFLNLLGDSIGTARILLMVNYRPEYRHEWGQKTYYTQLRLDPLGRESAEEMLSALLGDGEDLIPLKRLIIEKTEGTPLFMEEIYQALIEEGALMRNGAAVKLAKALNQLKIPPTVQGIIASRIDRLPASEKELLQTLAVIGKEFPRALAREVVRRPDDELDRTLSDLQLAEFIYEQPAVGDIEYTFKHALTHEVAYNSVLIERRKSLHERAGRALESMFAEHLNDHLSALALHYSRSANLTKAIDYLRRAGEQSSARSAFREAVAQLNRALELVGKLPAGPDRDSQELSVRMMLFGPLLATRFFTDQESRGNLEAARALCGRIGNSAKSSAVLASLVYMYFNVGELRSADELVSKLLAISEREPNELSAFRAHWSAGIIDTWMGRLRSARMHLAAGLEIDNGLIVGTFDEPRLLLGWSHLAWVLCALGYPDQALRAEARLLDFLNRPIDLFSRATILQAVLAAHCHLLRDYRGMRGRVESLIALSREHGLSLFGIGLVQLGRIEVEEGSVNAGIETMLEGMRTLRETGQILPYDHFCCVLAEGYLAAGHAEEGLSVLDEAITSSVARGQLFFEAEMYRLKGELSLLSGARDDGEKSIRDAVAVAREQEAKLFELRSITGLARLLRDTGRRAEARTMLAEIYRWFTEGFDTPDLKRAKALLRELSI